MVFQHSAAINRPKVLLLDRTLWRDMQNGAAEPAALVDPSRIGLWFSATIIR
jgi:hypothetical protein